jgi:hypothetical protein
MLRQPILKMARVRFDCSFLTPTKACRGRAFFLYAAEDSFDLQQLLGTGVVDPNYLLTYLFWFQIDIMFAWYLKERNSPSHIYNVRVVLKRKKFPISYI